MKTMRKIFPGFLFVYCFGARAFAATDCAQVGPALTAMVEVDQAVRSDFMAAKDKPGVSAQELDKLNAHWSEVDHTNTEALKVILRDCGWPAAPEASSNAWLLAQHADKDRPFQRQALELLRAAVDRKQATPRDLAYLSDRLDVADDRLQQFGTQFHQYGRCSFVLFPVDSLEQVDERRRAIGMESLAEYAARGRKAGIIPADCPAVFSVSPPAASLHPQ
jgi:hypothetical protein